MTQLATSPWTDAVDRTAGKTAVGSAMRSSEWADMPLALRERAIFSAGMQNVQVISSMRDKLVSGLDQSRPGGVGMDRTRFVSEMRALVGAAPGDSGDLTDFGSRRRLELIWNFQVADANGFAGRKADLDPNILDAFPAYRLVRVEARRVPRDWYIRWAQAGEQVGWEGASQETMVALKTSPIWAALSRFGRPWPPFDYGSGMGLEDVERTEAEDLDLLPKDESPADRLQSLSEASAAAQQGWNDDMSASVKNLSDTSKGWIQDAFGDQVSVDGDTVQWRGASSESDTKSTLTATGAPVSDALDVGVTGDSATEVKAAIAAIDNVHDDGLLPKIPISNSVSGANLGQYAYTFDGKAHSIGIRQDGNWPSLTTAHEVGHFIDHQVLGNPGEFASVFHDLLSDFRTAILKTDAVREIEAETAISARGKRYLLGLEELWARAYAQYVAETSGDATMLRQLKQIRSSDQSWKQWSKQDFKPVADAITEVLRKKGWIQ